MIAAHPRVAAAAVVLAGALLLPVTVEAQLNGSVSVLFDVLPDVSERRGSQAAGELRSRLFVERSQQVGEHVRINLAGYVDGLLRGGGGVPSSTTDAVVLPADAYVELTWPAFDVRAGMSRLVWGRLDELQPTDVVNPIDLARFVLEGRGEARLAVALVRGRLHLPASSTIEIVAVPAFRRGRFDQLGESTSPFNLTAATPLPVLRDEPPVGWNDMQGGARFTTTTRRVDWGLSGYTGMRAFPVVTARGTQLIESFPRFVMIGGDFETVRGPWGLRGEAAAFVRDELQSTRALTGVPGRSAEAGVGLDRRTGDYRIAANVIWAWRGVDASDPVGRLFEGDEEVERHDVSLVLAADRSFARETRHIRLFGVYDPADRTVFGRAIVDASLRDNLALEGSVGLFAGSSLDIIGGLTRRDFVYLRLKTFF